MEANATSIRWNRNSRWRFVLLGVACLATAAIVAGYVAAAPGPEQDKCCTPAYNANPTTPPPGSDQCKLSDATDLCTDYNGACTGAAWQNAIPGACQTLTSKMCTPPGTPPITTVVTIKLGNWSCPGGGTSAPRCIWALEFPVQSNQVQVANCTGDGCP
jgi:hypothetical protein